MFFQTANKGGVPGSRDAPFRRSRTAGGRLPLTGLHGLQQNSSPAAAEGRWAAPSTPTNSTALSRRTPTSSCAMAAAGTSTVGSTLIEMNVTCNAPHTACGDLGEGC